MTTPTQDLYNEHGGIFMMLKIMEEVAHRLDKGQKVEKKDLKRIVTFLKNFADKCHHTKEEDILFPLLFKDRKNRSIINELLGEHKTGRDYIKGISESVKNYKPGNSDAVHIALNARGYAELLKNHIKKESAILFPVADKFPKKIQVAISKRFEKLERDVVGAGKHEEYHGWLTELKNAYLT